MKKQSAVDFFYQHIRDSRDGFTFEELSEWRQQAKQMEKEQIIDAHDNGYIDGGNRKTNTAEQYYNETYGKE